MRICLGLPKYASTAASVLVARDHPAASYLRVDALLVHISHLDRIPSLHLAALPASADLELSGITAGHRARAALTSNFSPAARPSLPFWCLSPLGVLLTVPEIKKKT